MLKCRDVSELCSLEMEQPIAWGQRLSLRLHLMMCPGCTNYREQLQVIRAAMQAYAEGMTDTSSTREASKPE